MKRRAFTLVEILLAMALVGLVLVALNTFVFSMGELWGRNSDARLFDQHVRAVTRFLQREALEASLPPAAAVNSAPIGVQEVSAEGLPQENLVTYMKLTGGRILHWPESPLPEVFCSLQVRRGQGLFLLWHSDLENHFNDDPPRETLVSPFVTALAYDYFDTDFNKWVTETAFRTDASGNPLAPQRVRFTFAFGHLTREAVVLLPQTKAGLPNPW